MRARVRRAPPPREQLDKLLTLHEDVKAAMAAPSDEQVHDVRVQSI